MILEIEAPPLREDSTGAIRIGKSRVLLELVIHAFEDGTTPETIVQMYPTTTLADIYSVIGYYLHHQEVVKSYLEKREIEADKVRERIENHQGDLSHIRNRLLARKNKK